VQPKAAPAPELQSVRKTRGARVYELIAWRIDRRTSRRGLNRAAANIQMRQAKAEGVASHLHVRDLTVLFRSGSKTEYMQEGYDRGSGLFFQKKI